MSLTELQRYCGRYPMIASACGGALGTTVGTSGTGALGTDFGCRIAEGSLTAGSSHPDWSSSPADRIVFGASNTQPNVVGYNVPARIQITNNSVDRHLIQDTKVDASLATGGPSEYCIDQADDDSIMVAEYVTATGADSYGIGLSRGIVRNVYVDSVGGDGVRFRGAGPKLLERFLIRRTGRKTGQHGDGISATETTSNVTVRNGIVCSPDDDSSYYESGGLGQVNNSLRIGGTDSITLSDWWFQNIVCLGGATSVGCNAKNLATTNGIAFLNILMTKAGVGTWWSEFNDFYPNAVAGGTTKNILVWGARYIEDGTEVVHSPSSTGIDGLWEYEKATCPMRIKLAAYRLGLLDASFDLTAHADTGRTGWLNPA